MGTPEKLSDILLEKKKMGRFFSDSQKLAILKRSGYSCQICGIQLTADNFSADHIIPYSKGGKTQQWKRSSFMSLL